MIRELASWPRRIAMSASGRAVGWLPDAFAPVRIGLAVGSGAARAVAVRGRRVLWTRERELVVDEPLDGALATLLAATPAPRRTRVPRWLRRGMRRPVVNVALSSAYVQLKRLTRLPPLTDAGLLAGIVREGVGRFFLTNGVPLVTSGVRLESDGATWAAAYERPILASVDAACRAAGVRFGRVAPVVIVLPLALPSERIVWPDGDWLLDIGAAAGRLVSVRRSPAGADADACDERSTVPALASLGEDGWRFADAYGAAILPAHEPLALAGASGASAPATNVRWEGASWWRLGAAFAAMVLALTAAALTPGMVARVEARRAAAALALLAPERARAAAEEAELRTVTAALADVEAFARTRRPMTRLLAELSDALPDSTALVSLRVDSTGGSVVALGLRAAALVGALEDAPSLAAPELVGSVTRERAPAIPPAPGAPVSGSPSALELERATVRFRLAARPPVAAFAQAPPTP